MLPLLMPTSEALNHLQFLNNHRLAKFEHNRIIRTTQNLSFLTKKHQLFLTKRRHHLEEVSVATTIIA